MRNVTISYVNDEGQPMSYQGDMSDEDLSGLIRILDGETFEDLHLEYVEKNGMHG
jgi:hypothetical protein